MLPLSERERVLFWAKVDMPPDAQACWIWTAYRHPMGYGAFTRRINGRKRPYAAHRVAYQEHRGPVPDGLVLDHLCRRPSCVNPSHLEAVTNAENIRRSYDGGCKNGHKWTPENTRITAKGARSCRACHRAEVKRYKAKVRASIGGPCLIAEQSEEVAA